jgi:hypothetical protein
MIIENILLTDFKNEKFNSLNLDNLDDLVEDLNNKIKNMALYGECETPKSFDISLKNVSHILNKVYLKDNEVYGDVKILDTYFGKSVKEILESDKDFKLEFEPRLYFKRNMIYKIFTFDLKGITFSNPI